ncbi:alpha/beta fold hydrolase [Pseudoalteromonas sp. L23]|uniref:alpha/beta fold hydrolase n=1 Tax=unclassified Pseudoalteromonas TaxID=194690 RepID=UPI001EF09BB8|nr:MULTISPECIES: alpha/beta fold hydrolase [unclassified Pseudoalteromonas]MCF7515725.1 alpha/beta fold hydrolase [Pseudoalteromonas sp. L7]MCF7527767.1 alpha/beta fold hydrolase [Pseudoalteromonas sp. L23]MCX2768676.1 alpha/beta fold hydrolase [Pseudoalteromonas sp. B530]
MSLLYQHGDALRRFHLAVGEGHQLGIEEYGSSDGTPLIMLHGGPGQGHSRNVLGYFNPQKYRIILFSQRGCGNSTPTDFSNINTANLLKDIHTIRAHLGLQKIVLAGESFGAMLALLYAEQHREDVSGMVLWSSFLGNEADLHWLYGSQGAPAQIYPEQYLAFAQGAQTVESLLDHYHSALFGEDELLKRKAAQRWCEWDNLITTDSDTQGIRLCKADKQLSKAQHMVHFFSHQCFIKKQQITADADQLNHLPIWFIHSRHDLMCRYAPVHQLAQSIKAQLLILNGVGHCSANPVYVEAIRRAADLLLCKIQHH